MLDIYVCGRHHNLVDLHGYILESVDSANYLGITLQSNLKWNKHIDQTASKANKTLSCVRRDLERIFKAVFFARKLSVKFWFLIDLI
jgi:predicted GIY-YIG superfamily endonuclease